MFASLVLYVWVFVQEVDQRDKTACRPEFCSKPPGTSSPSFVRGLCIATGNTPHSACGFNARHSGLHGSSSSGQRTGRSERKIRGTRDRGRRQNKETTNALTCDDMLMNMFHADTSCDTLSHNVMCAQG